MPSNLYEYANTDDGNASAKFARSTMQLLPDNYTNFCKSGCPLSILYTPLADLNENDTPVPLIDKRD